MSHCACVVEECPSVDDSREDVLVARAKTGEPAARLALLESQMRAVQSLAGRYHDSGQFLDHHDLVQYGCLGVLRAIDKYDPLYVPQGPRASFSTYATYWIQHFIRRSIQNRSRTVAIPISVQRDLRKLDQARGDRRAEGLAEMREEEIAESLDLSQKRWESVCVARFRPVSLDSSSGESLYRESTLAVASVDMQEMERHMDEEKRSSAVQALVSQLPPRQRYVIERLFGLCEQEEITEASELSRELGVTPARVRQLKRRALARLRELCETEMVL